MSVRIERVQGAAVAPYLRDLSALRCQVFREYPYLYEGSLEYEQRYLQSYAESARSVVVLAWDASQVVGASTALPLLSHSESLAPVLARAGFDPARIYYFGESVLRADYRGQRIGHAFFDEREASARELGFERAAFCAVVRPDDHPARPASYVPHDAFWQRRGFRKREDIATELAWPDLGDTEETLKRMVFWLKDLRS